MNLRPPRGALALAALTLAFVGVSGCSSDSGSSTTSSSAAGAIRDGGTLRVGILGSSADTLDVAQATSPLAYAVALNVFDSVALLQGSEITYRLAEAVTPNDDATQWTITVREGVTFHDGTDLTADDVLYSLRYLSESPNYASLWSGVDWDASTSDGEHTVVVAFSAPKAAFVEEALARMSVVFPEGSTQDDFAKPVGSGPFEVESFSADTGAVLVKNEDYWGDVAHLDEVQLVPMADPTARVTALTGGQIDYASGITATGAETLASSKDVTVQNLGVENSSAFLVTMNTTTAPFDDPEVRTAFRELVDREQLVEVVFRGEGEVGNDILGMGLPGYDTTIPQRAHDPEGATAVLQEKGVTEVGILAAETTPGIMDAVRLLQQQLDDAGITLTITEADPANLFHDMQAIYSAQMFATYAVNVPVASMLMIMTSAGSPFNYSQWNDSAYNTLLTESMSIIDPTERQENLDALQEMLWNDGGDILWGYQPALSASVSTLTGMTVAQNNPLFGGAGYTG